MVTLWALGVTCFEKPKAIWLIFFEYSSNTSELLENKSWIIYNNTETPCWSRYVLAWPKNQSYELQKSVVLHSMNNSVPSESQSSCLGYHVTWILENLSSNRLLCSLNYWAHACCLAERCYFVSWAVVLPLLLMLFYGQTSFFLITFILICCDRDRYSVLLLFDEKHFKCVKLWSETSVCYKTSLWWNGKNTISFKGHSCLIVRRESNEKTCPAGWLDFYSPFITNSTLFSFSNLFFFLNTVTTDKNDIFIASWCVTNEVEVKSWIQ